jgi:hypothetical protein
MYLGAARADRGRVPLAEGFQCLLQGPAIPMTAASGWRTPVRPLGFRYPWVGADTGVTPRLRPRSAYRPKVLAADRAKNRARPLHV